MWLVALLSCASAARRSRRSGSNAPPISSPCFPVGRAESSPARSSVFVGVLGLLWLVHACVWVKLPSYFHSALNDRSDNTEIALLSGSSLLMVFGVAWLFSSFLASPTWAACIALASIFALFMAVSLAETARHKIGGDSTLLVITLPIGIAAFVGGTVYYLYRIDP